MFKTKLKDGTIMEFELERLDSFFDKHGDNIQLQPNLPNKRRYRDGKAGIIEQNTDPPFKVF